MLRLNSSSKVLPIDTLAPLTGKCSIFSPWPLSLAGAYGEYLHLHQNIGKVNMAIKEDLLKLFQLGFTPKNLPLFGVSRLTVHLVATV